MERIILCFLMLWSGLITSAQSTDADLDLTFMEKNFFQQKRAEWMFGATPSVKVFNRQTGEFQFNVSTTVISLGGVAYEPRINLKNFADKASISLSVPLDLSLGLGVTHPDDAVNTGFFTFSTGFFLDGNLGNHSTYNNVDLKGISVGIGFRIHKAPLFGIPEYRDRYKFSKFSTGFSLRGQYKIDFRNYENRVFYFETGIPGSFENEGIRYIENLYVILGTGVLLNY